MLGLIVEYRKGTWIKKLCHSTEAGGINAVKAKRRTKSLPVVGRFHGGCGMRGRERNLHMEKRRRVCVCGGGDHSIYKAT